ncbi:MAG: alpha-hydroxy-acid oxidizing protein [Proteobacteria bacterium]|nr:alpha-hydroxy-acid oxidizing protein [Pseudomonadota bacterium]
MTEAADEFETLHEIVKRARENLSRDVWDYVVGGAETETTLKRNRRALDSIAFRPRVLRDVSAVDCSSTFLGERLRIPVVLAPIGSLEDVESGGGVTVARAAGEFGVASMLSSVCRPGLEEVAAASDGPLIYNLYVRGDADWIADHVRRALTLGDLGLIAAARSELRLAERANKGDADALLVLRDSYDILGLHDRALLLSTRSAGHDDDIHRLYPSHYWDEVASAARDANVDPYLVLSVIRQESYFNEAAVSHAGAVGLMQIMPQTGHKLARRLGVSPFDRRLLFDPGVSIRLGARFLGDQVRSFAAGSHDLQFPLGLAAYNAGPKVARRWLERFPVDDADAFVERIPYKETRLYVKKVLKNYAIYKTLNGSKPDA